VTRLAIELLDEKSIGRNYQLVALGIVLNDVSEDLRERIIDGITTGSIELASEEYELIRTKLAEYLQLVCMDDKKTPKLYTAGEPKDKDILVRAGILRKEDSSGGEKRTRKNILCERLVEALRSLPVEKLSSTVPVPMFLRTYMFSYYRHLSKTQEMSVASLLLALTGSVVSLISRIQNNEVYIVPDASTTSVMYSKVIYDLFYLARQKGVIEYESILNKIMGLGGISVDQAVLMSLLIWLSHVKDVGGRLASSIYDAVAASAFESFILVRIDSSGNRPLLVSATPATVSFVIRKLTAKGSLEVLPAINSLISSKGIGGEIEDHVKSASSKCLNQLFMYIETGVVDHLLECSRDLVTLVDKISGNQKTRNIESSARRVLYYLSRLA
jgi:hypothetical protein